jgi:hypothetical protein
MTFVGRTRLVSVIDELINVSGWPQDSPEQVRPVLVVHGCGGTGRTRLLTHVRHRWKDHPPIALVTPSRLADQVDGVPRPFLSAVWLDLAAEVRFPRLALAHLAMAAPALPPDAGDALAEIRGRIAGHGSTQASTVITTALSAGGTAAATAAAVAAGQDPAVGQALGPLFERTAQATADGLRRGLLRRVKFDSALRWFARRSDDEHAGGGERELIRLHRWAWARGGATGADIDDVLVGALLADVTEAVARNRDRAASPALLIDDADGPAASGFLGALLRRRAAEDAEPDSLTVIAASGGPLIDTLNGVDSRGERTYSVDDARQLVLGHRSGEPLPWISVPLTALSGTETRQLFPADWPDERTRFWVVDTVHRVTAGHPGATQAVLQLLPGAIRRHDGNTLAAHLGTELAATDRLKEMVDGLASTVPSPIDVLVTLSAARNLAEATRLVGDTQLQLVTVADLWTRDGDRDRPAPARLLRHLLLQQLTERRPVNHRSAAANLQWDWTSVHRLLRDRAAAEQDDAGRLHHQLALGETLAVQAELIRLLPVLDGAAWLDLLDEVTAIPLLRRSDPGGPADSAAPDGGTSNGGAPPQAIAELVTGLAQLADPRLARDERIRLSLAAAHGYLAACQDAKKDHRVFLDRAEEARSYASSLA